MMMPLSGALGVREIYIVILASSEVLSLTTLN